MKRGLAILVFAAAKKLTVEASKISDAMESDNKMGLALRCIVATHILNYASDNQVSAIDVLLDATNASEKMLNDLRDPPPSDPPAPDTSQSGLSDAGPSEPAANPPA